MEQEVQLFEQQGDQLQLQIEALLFAAEKAVKIEEISASLAEAFELTIDTNEATEILETITTKYSQAQFPFEVVQIAGGYQLLTKPIYHKVIGAHLKLKTKKQLSKAALETLSIIAYKQPTTKSEIERIRGVNSDYSCQKLLEKELVEIAGRSEGPGKPLLYKTTERFMDYFGINSIDDLPKPKDFSPADQEIGTPTSIENETTA